MSATGDMAIAPPAPNALGRAVWIRVGTLVDGTGAAPMAQAHVVYDADRIRYVGDQPPPSGSRPGGRTEPDAVLPDVTALPCLLEAHAHLFLDGAPIDRPTRDGLLVLPPATMLDRARLRLRRLAAMGIAAIRDAGDKHGVGLALQAEALADRGGAWLDSPGAAIFHQGRYGDFMGRPVELDGGPEPCVEGRCRAGARRIKLLATGIINFAKAAVTAPPQMTAAEIAAFCAAARGRGRQVFAHASGTPGVENAIEGGVTTVEHGFFVTSDQLGRMRDRRIAWVPTFAPVQVQLDRADAMGWDDAARAGLRTILDAHAERLREAVARGVRILAGSDAGSCGVPHGLGLLTEMACMEKAGMPSLAVLHAATGAAAATLDFPDPLGRVATGCRARFILTRHSPLATVGNLARARTILWDGSAHCHDDHESEEGL